jgi:hypothetical protein
MNPTSLLEEIQNILPTLNHFELEDVRHRIKSPKQRLIYRIEHELERLDETDLQELLDQLLQKKRQRLRETLQFIKDIAEAPDEPPFELEPSRFRMPRNEQQLQRMIDMARAEFEPEREP